MYYLLYSFFYMPFSDFFGRICPDMLRWPGKIKRGAVPYVLETWVCRVDVVVLVAILGGGAEVTWYTIVI